MGFMKEKASGIGPDGANASVKKPVVPAEKIGLLCNTGGHECTRALAEEAIARLLNTVPIVASTAPTTRVGSILYTGAVCSAHDIVAHRGRGDFDLGGVHM